MKLAAIYNVWDGVELLEGSIRCIADHVDMIIIVYQDVSNFGEAYDPFPEIYDIMINNPLWKNFHIVKYDPVIARGGTANETQKRNAGLEIARLHRCTHFLHMDCDEYYKNFGSLKRYFIESNLAGSYMRLMTYFAIPTFRLETYDNYYVPFIHELQPDTRAGSGGYPAYVDPTRAVNVVGHIAQIGYRDDCMHHFSWIRKDIKRKARNSSARANIEKSQLLQDYRNAHAGMYLQDYAQKLIEVENYFNIVI